MGTSSKIGTRDTRKEKEERKKVLALAGQEAVAQP